jgi:hypothetical protein
MNLRVFFTVAALSFPAVLAAGDEGTNRRGAEIAKGRRGAGEVEEGNRELGELSELFGGDRRVAVGEDSRWRAA